MSDLCRVGVAIDAPLLEQFDRLIARRGYANRSEAVRDLIRAELIGEEIAAPGTPVVGALTLVYDHHVRLLSEKLTQVQHDHHASIISTLHVHLDPHHCLEVVVLRGRRDHVTAIADRLIATKGVSHGRLTLTAVHK
jgi:CopG family nickel-responsive transcriptional regulator